MRRHKPATNLSISVESSPGVSMRKFRYANSGSKVSPRVRVKLSALHAQFDTRPLYSVHFFPSHVL